MRAVFLALSLAAIGTSCAARVTQFHNFAEAGVNYVKASAAVLDEAGTAAIRADSMILADGRAALSPDERRTRLLASNKALRERMTLLRDLGRHNRLLQRYFEALAAIADSTAPDAAAAAAENLFTSLGGLSAAIKSNPILKSGVPQITKLVVGSFRSRALEQELRRRADAVAAELALQEAAYTAIGELLTADLTVQLNKVESNQVVTPFAQEGTLPKDWIATREQFLKSTAAAASTDAAAKAAKALRESFEALVSNRFSITAMTSLLGEMREMASVAGAAAMVTREE